VSPDKGTCDIVSVKLAPFVDFGDVENFTFIVNAHMACYPTNKAGCMVLNDTLV